MGGMCVAGWGDGKDVLCGLFVLASPVVVVDQCGLGWDSIVTAMCLNPSFTSPLLPSGSHQASYIPTCWHLDHRGAGGTGLLKWRLLLY